MENQITNQRIQEVADKIVKEYQPEKIILFGSYA
jgi:predicted nucleotidyltransferase